MRDKADLIDKSERLEHIILQLQGETDTIGRSLRLYIVAVNCLMNDVCVL